MTYSAGNVILSTDYNGFVQTGANNINAVWSTTYGQTALNQVTAVSNTVSAQQWTDLNNTLSYIATHQGTSITSRTNPQPGNVISILANLATDIDTVNSNRYNSTNSGTQFAGWTGTASRTTVTGHRATSWTITFSSTIQFANATAATNFWGAGGLVKIQFAKTSTGLPADAAWNTLATTTCGAVFISADAAAKSIANVSYNGTTVIGGSGSPTVTNKGWNQLTGTPANVYVQASTQYVYTGDYIQVQASSNATSLILSTTWNSAARNVPGTSNEISGGAGATAGSLSLAGVTAPTTLVSYFPPATTGPITNTWGTPTVTNSVSAPVY
jgi:hypothetical protein